MAMDRRGFFEHVLAYFGRRAVLGAGHAARGFAELDGALGPLVETLHGRLASTRTVTARGDFRLGPRTGRPVLSLVTVLYGVPDFLFLLVSQFARFAPLDQVEFLFVCNSPEMEEAVLRDAELAAFTFRTTVRAIGVNQNSGFSHANNLAIEEAEAPSVLVINPDVFPRRAGAVERLVELAQASAPRRRLIGGRLFYADGTVMHDGMVCEPDPRLSAQTGGRPAVLVEHLRKGFPARDGDDAPSAVQAVSGALMLMDRALAREMGPFDEGYVLGHYEDADLCLRLAEAGGEVLVDPALAFWHYEGRGSVTRPEHRGSALYNRWRFSRRWGAKLAG
jgi:GT2 family glycosyltransferase